MVSYAALSSGELGFTTLRSLIQEGNVPKFILTDKSSVKVMTLAREYNIPCHVGNPRQNGFADRLAEHGVPDLILSVNYLFIIETNIITIPQYGCVNVHGSLLPKYRGRTPHVWAIINNEQMTGVTAHFIDAGCDTGRILFQKEISIGYEMTGGEILEIFADLYPKIAREILLLFDNKENLPLGSEQDESKATYFGKRTELDGRINWEWWRERIRNWVRAQSAPYPGAFCYYGDTKVVIDKIVFSDVGYKSDQLNGTILTGGTNPVVKTCNGAIRLASLRNDIEFKEGVVLL